MRVGEDRSISALPDAPPARLGDDEHVAQVAERHAVGEHARVGDLAPVLVGAEAQRRVDDAVVLLPRAPARPVAVLA